MSVACQGLRIIVLGALALTSGGETVALPPSRKTRALLAFLVMTRRPQRRERLCEIFWDVPDDPRGALRWSLSKLRPLVNREGQECLVADRERVAFVRCDVAVDYLDWRERLDGDLSGVPASELEEAAAALRQPLLDGIDLPNLDLFQAWLVAEREDVARLQRQILGRLATDSGRAADDRLRSCREWQAADPFNPEAAGALTHALALLGRRDEAARVISRFRDDLAAAGLPAVSIALAQPARAGRVPPPPVTGRQLLHRQRIRFCAAPDGARLAFATVGEGPPLVKAANWLNHLELDWDSPVWSPLFRDLARDHRLVRYDERGNGLSDWAVPELSFEAFVRDLETVVDAAEIDRFPLLGISQGCAVAIEYAARHPGRVSHLVLWGGYAAGWRVAGDAGLRAEREAQITLVRRGWGRQEPTYRQIFSASFMPGATHEELDWFNDFQRQTASAENAARFLDVFADIDVRHRLRQVRAPTLVMHARDDQRVPVSVGSAVAAGIAGAEFVTLESANHILLGREPASTAFVTQVRQFIAA